MISMTHTHQISLILKTDDPPLSPPLYLSMHCSSEPTDPYLVITDPSDYLDPAKLYKPRPTR
jgi:hypothetical protein